MLRHLLILIIFVGCNSDDQKSYSRLEGLRILGLIADAPEVVTPQTVTITPYLSYPEGGDTTINVSFEACLDPGIAFGADPDCSDSPPSLILNGSSQFATSTIGNGSFYTGAMTAIPIAIPPTFFAALGTQGEAIQFNGIDLLVLFRFEDQAAPANSLQAIKRIRLSTKTAGVNTNPTISGDFQSNGGVISSFPITLSELSLSGLSQPESYSLKDSSGVVSNLTEQMTVSWFSTVGDFQFSRTDPDQPTEFDPQGATQGVFVGVYRDNRGGVTVIQKTVP